MSLSCVLVECGKFRNGADRRWCKTHQCAFGTKADLVSGKCRSADIPVSILRAPPLFSGEMSAWYAMKPAIYLGDRRRKFQEGVHIHTYDRGVKQIDATFPGCILRTAQGLFAVTPTIARSRVSALIAGIEQQDAQCPKCKHLHNDLGYFAETLHKMHLCGTCGGTFFTSEKNTCNSLAALPSQPQSREPEEFLDINSFDFSAIAVWATTPALFSTHEQVKNGIHLHAWQGSQKAIDETFASVRLNGSYLDRKQLLEAMLGSTNWNKSALYQQEIVH